MKVCLACACRYTTGDWTCPACGHTPVLRHGYPVFAPELSESNDGFDAHYFDNLARLEAGHFWFCARNRLLIWALRRYFPQARCFLEVGCGTGFVLSGLRQALPGLSLAGSDIFESGLTHAAQRLPGVRLFQMDARHIPFEQEFDVIGAFDVLEHIREDEFALTQMFQAIRPGGGIIVTVPQHRFLWSKLDDYSFHKRRYGWGNLVAKARRAGFSIVRVTSFVSLLLPAMLAARLTKTGHSQKFDPLAELQLSPGLNVVFEKIMGVEHMLIAGGVSFPVGGSLLLVARRPEAAEP